MFKNVLRIAVQEAFPPRTRGRPALVGFDDAYDDILRVVRTGMQWRYLRPTAAVAYITVFKTMHKWCRVRCAHWPVVRGRNTLAGSCADAREEYFVRTRLTKQTVTIC